MGEHSVEIFNNFGDPNGAGDFLGRWGHILFGITWIGLLYFFNVVQVPAFAQMEAGARSEALRKVTWRALWWFRWAALFTFLTGVWLLIFTDQYKFKGPQGAAIFIGAVYGTTMFLNVWGVIWRMQKINIGSAEAVAAGGQADPRAAKAANAAGRASRINTFFSIPMLWLMVFAAHSGEFTRYDDSGGKLAAVIIIGLAIWAVMEASALGLIGGLDNAINKAVLADHRKTIIGGFIVLLVIQLIGFELIVGGA
jgi:uncharacterized membrane protein